jgi:hypothetical protein
VSLARSVGLDRRSREGLDRRSREGLAPGFRGGVVGVRRVGSLGRLFVHAALANHKMIRLPLEWS